MTYQKHARLALAVAQTLFTSVACAAGVPDDAPAEGYLFRQLAGDAAANAYGIQVQGYMQLGAAHNSNSSAASRAAGNSNFPVAPGDEGFKLEDLKLIIGKPMASNILPRITPLPGPVPADFSVGFQADLMYGRSGQPAGMFGFDQNWGVNQPGAGNPALAASNRQNFLAVPQFYVQAYFPLGYGVALTAGRFGAGIGYEIAPQVRPTPNLFYSRSYAFLAQPDQVAGALVSANVMRGAAGLMAVELGAVKGWQNLQDNNGSRSIIGAVRWRSAGMGTAVNYSFITGNEQNDPGATVQAPVATIISPRGQRRQHHSLSASSHIAEGWDASAEILYGRQAGDGRPDTVSIVTGPRFSGARYRGQNAMLSYRANPGLRYSARLEHFSSPDGFGLFPLAVARSDFNATTFGAQFDLNRFIAFRPEIRYDWQSRNNGNRAFGNGTASKQTTLSADMVLRF
ncbi:MAG: outer membrane beta-barrel protein [Pseudomonadota bacterium]